MVNLLISEKEEYKRWLEQGKDTLLSPKRDKEAGDHNWSCFKAQQAAEFAVKALLYGIGVSAIGHSLLKFLGDLEQKGIKTDEIRNFARTLDRHYIPTRYVNAHAEGAPFEFYDLPTAEEAVRCASDIIEFVEEVAERE